MNKTIHLLTLFFVSKVAFAQELRISGYRSPLANSIAAVSVNSSETLAVTITVNEYRKNFGIGTNFCGTRVGGQFLASGEMYEVLGIEKHPEPTEERKSLESNANEVLSPNPPPGSRVYGSATVRLVRVPEHLLNGTSGFVIPDRSSCAYSPLALFSTVGVLYFEFDKSSTDSSFQLRWRAASKNNQYNIEQICGREWISKTIHSGDVLNICGALDLQIGRFFAKNSGHPALLELNVVGGAWADKPAGR